MPLPPNVAKIKVHPAIGFARLSTNPDSFDFGDVVTDYKSNDRIKRQAVQYRLFCYDAGGEGIEELTPQKLASYGLSVRWKASVGNKKISSQSTRDSSYTITADASSDDANHGLLVGKCGDFAEGQHIALGQIMPDGRFMPPIARVYRKDATVPIPDFGMFSDSVTDNSCDGWIRAVIRDNATGQSVLVPVADAWVVVAPPDFAPEWNDDPSVPPTFYKNLLQSLELLLALPNNPTPNPINRTARDLDRAVLQTGTGDFAPGIEINPLNSTGFQSPAVTGDPDEVRVSYDPSGTTGTTPGGLTSGLCSPWQYDFRACTCNYWPNHRPDVAFRNASTGPEVNWKRKVANDTTAAAVKISTNPEYIDHVYELGIIRKQNNQRVETERDNNVS